MDVISLDELKILLEVKSVKCDAVSIFMPTYKTGAETKQNPAVLEKLLAESQSQLLATSFARAADVHNYLFPVKELLNDKTARQHPGKGLAIFLYHDFFDFILSPLVSRSPFRLISAFPSGRSSHYSTAKADFMSWRSAKTRSD